MSSSTEAKLTLPAFLKLLTNGKMRTDKAMALASKVFKKYNTPSLIGSLSDSKLKALGVDAKEDRKLALEAFKKAGYAFNAARSGGSVASGANEKLEAVGGAIAEKGEGPLRVGKKLQPKKRKRDDDLLLPAPGQLPGEEVISGNLDFGEVLDEEVLKSKVAVVNRAPVMCLWATIVAERLGFEREEALSIASAYTEMNAVSKGVNLGIYKREKEKDCMEASKGGSQPYVDLMGRRVPLYKTQTSTWRALLHGTPCSPTSSFSYITRSFRQTLPFISGSMRLLASAFSDPKELNEKGFALYADFRPDVGGWGQRGEVRCKVVLELRGVASVHVKKEAKEEEREEVVRYEKERQVEYIEGPQVKRRKGMSVEEYEDALDASTDFADLLDIEDF